MSRNEEKTELEINSPLSSKVSSLTCHILQSRGEISVKTSWSAFHRRLSPYSFTGDGHLFWLHRLPKQRRADRQLTHPLPFTLLAKWRTTVFTFAKNGGGALYIRGKYLGPHWEHKHVMCIVTLIHQWDKYIVLFYFRLRNGSTL